MRKIIVSSLLGFFLLGLIFAGSWIIWDLSKALGAIQQDVHNIALELEQTSLELAAYEKGHGSAQAELALLQDEVISLRKTAQEHDSLIMSLGVLVNQ